jgi:hypothetical protein
MRTCIQNGAELPTGGGAPLFLIGGGLGQTWSDSVRLMQTRADSVTRSDSVGLGRTQTELGDSVGPGRLR